MATEIRYASNRIRHDNHLAPTTLTERTFVKPANTVLIVNTSVTNSAWISFDGLSLFTLKPGASICLDFSKQYTYWTKGDGVTTNMEVIVGAED